MSRIELLQWGRASAARKTPRVTVFTSAATGFNGAALQQRGRHAVQRADLSQGPASMGPRFSSAEDDNDADLTMTESEGFNGAALQQRGRHRHALQCAPDLQASMGPRFSSAEDRGPSTCKGTSVS